MKTPKLLLMILLVYWINIALLVAQPVVLVTYHSKTGTTQAMAEAVAKGAGSVEGVQVVLKTVEETTTEDLVNAGAIIVGSPVYNANIAPVVQEFITSWPFENAPLKDKLGAAFVTAGGISAGEEIALLNILHSMMIFNMIIIGGDDWTAPFGASAIRGEAPFDSESPLNESFLLKGENLGKRVAGILLRLDR